MAACRPCNTRKEDRLPHECGLSLRTSPAVPREGIWVLATTGTVRPDWEPYLLLGAGISA